MKPEEDILASFDLSPKISNIQENTHEIIPEPESVNVENSNIQESDTTTNTQFKDAEVEAKRTILKSCLSGTVFAVKYVSTSLCIFWVLMVGANYSAYFNLAYSVIFASEMEQTQKSLIRSVDAWDISTEKNENETSIDTFRELRKKSVDSIETMHNMWNLVNHDTIDLGIEITPYENRVIIPKIWKNIPLVEVQQQQVEWVAELNDIFMKELENGVVRYPGSAKPGENGNSFIFGHSSNFPWLDGEFNDVFALLDNVVYDDEVVVYYWQEKHTYKITTKNVIRPWDVSILKSDAKDDKSQITLMTCWPIGTTLNRLVLTGELIHVEK